MNSAIILQPEITTVTFEPKAVRTITDWKLIKSWDLLGSSLADMTRRRISDRWLQNKREEETSKLLDFVLSFFIFFSKGEEGHCTFQAFRLVSRMFVKAFYMNGNRDAETRRAKRKMSHVSTMNAHNAESATSGEMSGNAANVWPPRPPFLPPPQQLLPVI